MLPRNRQIAEWIYVSAQYMRPGEGSHTHVTGVIRALRSVGHSVDMLRPEYNPSDPPSAWERVVSVIVLQLRVGKRLWMKRGSATRSVLYIRAHMTLPLVAMAGRLLNYNVLVELNGLGEDNYRAWPALRRIRYIVEASRGLLFRLANALICVSEEIEKAVSKSFLVGQAHTEVIANGTNIDMFRPIPKTVACRKLNISERRQYLCFIGAFAEWQGLNLLIDGIRRVQRRNLEQEWAVLFAGAGELEELVEEISCSNDHVRYLGRLQHERIPYLINASNAGFMLHDSSGRSPLKLYEYLACQRLAICTDVSAADIVRKTQSGWIVSDAEELAAAISEAIQLDIDVVENRAREARSEVERHHSWIAVARRIENIAERIIRSRLARR